MILSKMRPLCFLKTAKFFLFLSVSMFFAGCNHFYQAQQLKYKDYQISPDQKGDSSLSVFLKPYGDSVSKLMDIVIAQVGTQLDKKQPEGTLGNVLTDAYLAMAKEKFKTHVDAAFANYGGLRVNTVAIGPLTLGKVYEIMPFDNILLIQKVKGNVLQEFLDFQIVRGGWPMAGISLQVKNKKAINVLVGGKPLDPDATYVIANADYVINGGDNVNMLKDIPRENIGYLMRDALIEYFRRLGNEGKPITAKIENRIVYVN
jgi:2',3'-cyclic-nucleotide 2'-phosphodiesterase (5'-nucleotidase family)